MIMLVATVLAMGTPPDGGSPWLQLVPFVLVLGIFYFIILLPDEAEAAEDRRNSSAG